MYSDMSEGESERIFSVVLHTTPKIMRERDDWV